MHILDMKRKKVASIPFSLSNLTIVGWDDEAIYFIPLELSNRASFVSFAQVFYQCSVFPHSFDFEYFIRTGSQFGYIANR